MTLVELFHAGGVQSDGIHNAKYDTDKGDAVYEKHHNYLPTYDKLFAPYQDQEINIFEVGYFLGGSARLWADYFPNATIYSTDVQYYHPCEGNLNSMTPTNDRIKMEILDVMFMTPESFVGKEPTIAIDDGSHLLPEQLHFIKTVWPVLKPGGIMVVEDVQFIDYHLKEYAALGLPMEIIDLRASHPEMRYDNVLLVFKKPDVNE